MQRSAQNNKSITKSENPETFRSQNQKIWSENDELLYLPSSKGRSWAFDSNPVKQFNARNPNTRAKTILEVEITNPILLYNKKKKRKNCFRCLQQNHNLSVLHSTKRQQSRDRSREKKQREWLVTWHGGKGTKKRVIHEWDKMI